MKLSVKTEYACRVLVQLARRADAGDLAHIEDLARAESIPPNYLVQILGELRTGGLILSRRGKQGGYALARRPAEITLHDILVLVEGDLLEPAPAPESQSSRRLAQAWREVRAALEKACRAITLEQLAARSDEDMYYI